MYMDYTQKSIYIELDKLSFMIHEHDRIIGGVGGGGTDGQTCTPHKANLTS